MKLEGLIPIVEIPVVLIHYYDCNYYVYVISALEIGNCCIFCSKSKYNCGTSVYNIIKKCKKPKHYVYPYYYPNTHIKHYPLVPISHTKHINGNFEFTNISINI